jgi:UDP-GlcNAc:undecaprenyl-phosphate GlcNAc-1-phosphate transferase
MLAFILAQLLTPLTCKLAWKFGILDYPNEARKIHKNPIPRIGGAAIFLAVMITCLRNLKFSPELSGLLISSSIIYIIGFIDDIHPLSAASRIIGQIIACAVLFQYKMYISILPIGFPLMIPLDMFITAVWMIGLSNALNFLDGVDGLAAGMAALCALLFCLIALPTHQKYLVYVGMSIAGACLGFITYNWKPATVYLGDAGATFLGFIIAGLAVMGTWGYHNNMIAISTPLLILGIPIFDMIYTTVSRINNGQVKTFIQWLEYAGRDHFHHRLMNLGLSDVHTVLFILLINLCLGLGAIVIRDSDTQGSILLLLQSIIILVIISILMIKGKDRSSQKSEKIFGLLRDTYKNGSNLKGTEQK